MVLDGNNDQLRHTFLMVLDRLGKIDLPTRLPTTMMRAGFVDLSVQMEASTVYTIIGAIDPERRSNHEIEMQAARPEVAKLLGSERACDDFYAAWFDYLDRPDTCTILPIWFVQGTVPW